MRKHFPSLKQLAFMVAMDAVLITTSVLTHIVHNLKSAIIAGVITGIVVGVAVPLLFPKKREASHV